MSAEDEFYEAMLALYKRTLKEIGYPSNYFLRAVRGDQINHGLAYAKRLLRPRKQGTIHKGWQAVIDAGRPDLTVEYLVQKPRFVGLFTQDEIAEAKKRLAEIPKFAFRRPVLPEENFPETLPEDLKYAEGAVRKITVSVFERDKKAREACIKKYGARCVVCKMSFVETYGEIGKGFIHVHHKKPLAAIRSEYLINPVKDLVPICPNCHAMLHTSEPPLSVDELQEIIRTK
jgi:5-methylcytosine-specific restriction enzyme A